MSDEALYRLLGLITSETIHQEHDPLFLLQDRQRSSQNLNELTHGMTGIFIPGDSSYQDLTPTLSYVTYK